MNNVQMLATYAIIYGVVLIAILLTLYIFLAIGLYGIAKTEGKGYKFLAWIPIANVFLFGSIADQVVRRKKGKGFCFSWLLTILFVASCVCLYFFGLWGLVPTALFLIGAYIALYLIYTDYASDGIVLYMILSIILVPVMPFILFFSRKDVPVTMQLYREDEPESIELGGDSFS